MKDLQEAREHICDLKGSVIAANTFMVALLRALPPDALLPLRAAYDKEAEEMRTKLLNTKIAEQTIDAFDRDVHGLSAILQSRVALL